MDIDEPQKQFEDTFKLLRVTFCTFGFYALKNTRIPAEVTHFASSGSVAALKSNSWNKSTKLWMAALMKSFKICLVFNPFIILSPPFWADPLLQRPPLSRLKDFICLHAPCRSKSWTRKWTCPTSKLVVGLKTT